METTLYAERPGRVAEVLATVGHQVKTGDLLVKTDERINERGTTGRWQSYREQARSAAVRADRAPSHGSLGSTSGLARSLLVEGLDELPCSRPGRQPDAGPGQGRQPVVVGRGLVDLHPGPDPAAHGLRVDQEPRLALMTAVAVIDAIRTLELADPGIGIRWPNDVEVDGRKLGGILPERVETGTRPSAAHRHRPQRPDPYRSAPAAVQQMATSLGALQPRPLDSSFLRRFLVAILVRFERSLYRLAEDDPALAEDWDRLNLLRDQTVRVALGPRVIEGKVCEIDAQGARLPARRSATPSPLRRASAARGFRMITRKGPPSTPTRSTSCGAHRRAQPSIRRRWRGASSVH